MKSQEAARTEKEKKKKLQIAQEAKEQKEYERIERERSIELNNIQKSRQPVIDNKFGGINFEYNSNKNNHLRAKNDCENHYYNISLENQTCSCDNFKSLNAKFEKFDIRRLCKHQWQIIKDRKLFKKNKNELEDFILENLFWNPSGIFRSRLEDDKEFAIISFYQRKELYVATPKTNKDGYLLVSWDYEKGEWSAKKGGKKVNDQVLQVIAELFDK